MRLAKIESTNAQLAFDDGGNILGFVSVNGAVASLVNMLATALARIIPSSGSVAANGALTLTTALPVAHTWGCYMYFPAGAVQAGSAAGFYYVVMSTASAGVIYADRYVSGMPTVPANPTPIVAAGPGAYAQVLTAITMSTVGVGANAMGKAGRILHAPSWTYPTNANNKTLATAFGASAIYSKVRTASTGDYPLIDIRNRGVASRQLSTWASAGLPNVGAANTPVNTNIDTSVVTTVTTTGQLAVATDYIVLEAESVELIAAGA